MSTAPQPRPTSVLPLRRGGWLTGFLALLTLAPGIRAEPPSLINRLDTLSEDDLRKQLGAMPEVGLDTGASLSLLGDRPFTFELLARQMGLTDFDPRSLVRANPEAVGFPLRTGRASRLDP